MRPERLLPIRTAVIGFGTSGRTFHAPFIASNSRFSLDAIVTADDGRRAEAAALHPQARLFRSAAELFGEAGELDLVVIGSPPDTHAQFARDALDAGLHVVVDKPFTVSSAEGRELIARAAECSRILTVYQNRRWDGDFLTLRRLLADGRLGQILRFESRFEWWKPRVEKSWKSEATAASGGGILFDLGTHLIDQALLLFGAVDGMQAEVLTRRAGANAEDDVFVAMSHASGVVSHLWMTSLAAQAGPRFRVLGTEGAYTKWGLDGQEAALKSGSLPTELNFGREPEEAWGRLGAGSATALVRSESGNYAGFYGELASAITTGSAVPVDPADSVVVIEAIQALHAAQKRHVQT
jgi:predicted dehydrogenase